MLLGFGVSGASGPVFAHAWRSTLGEPAAAATELPRIAVATTRSAPKAATRRRAGRSVLGTDQTARPGHDEDDDPEGDDHVGDAGDRRLVRDDAFEHAEQHAGEEAAPDARQPADQRGRESPQRE